MTDVVPFRRGDEAVIRTPTPAERHAHRLERDEPVIEIRRRDGTTEVYGTRHVTVLAKSPAPMPHPARPQPSSRRRSPFRGAPPRAEPPRCASCQGDLHNGRSVRDG